MHFTVLTYEPTDRLPLAPAPNVDETKYIQNVICSSSAPSVTNLKAGPIEILTDYRGSVLYCAGGVTMYRIEPKSIGGNQYTGVPILGSDENVILTSDIGTFRATIKFSA